MAIQLDPYILESLLPDLTGHDHRPSAFIVYLLLWSRTRGRRGQGVACSYQDIATDTGLAKRTVQIAVAHLLRRKLLSVRQATTTAIPVYEVLTPWRHRR
jgi:predicted DNA-binding transcriptional regulator